MSQRCHNFKLRGPVSYKEREFFYPTCSLFLFILIDMPLPPLTNPAQVPEQIKSICIFCGAGTGGDPIYVEHAKGKPIINSNQTTELTYFN
jgi:hypothetical protein